MIANCDTLGRWDYALSFVRVGKALKPEWNVPYAAIHTLSGMTAATLATLVTSPADCVKVSLSVLLARLHKLLGWSGHVGIGRADDCFGLVWFGLLCVICEFGDL